MEISSLSSLSASPDLSGPRTDAVLSSDFETFLRMLTAQARYQDPLEPLDSSEYAAQLAQFSMVEQQVLSNELLSGLAAGMGNGSLTALASWIGMEARSTAPVSFQGSPISLVIPPAPDAETTHLVVLRPDGTVAQRQEVPSSGGPMLWAGVNTEGTPLPSGTYRFELEKRTAGEVTGAEPVQSFALITEIRQDGNRTALVLSGGTTLLPGDVTALRNPDASAI